MSYNVKYINCKICSSDTPKFLGIRGNLEYNGASPLGKESEHMVTNIVKCRKCGFVYTNPLISISTEKMVHFYDDPDRYQSSICVTDPLKVFNRNLNIIERFTRHKGKLCDIGSGKGEFLAIARNRGWEVFGIEPSKKFVDYAKNIYGLDIQNSDIENANFPDDYFDVVTLNMVLEHIDNPHNLVFQIHRILKKGGLLYIEVPNMDSLLLKLIKVYFQVKGKDWSALLSPLHYPYHCYGYNMTSLKLLYSLHDFEPIKFFIFGIGLRGFHSNVNIGKFKKLVMRLSADIFGYINQGDILVALGIKK